MASVLLIQSRVTQLESVRVQGAIHSLESGDCARALAFIRDLADALRDGKEAKPAWPALADAFRSLLRRRGYFVSSPANFENSLDEIHFLGEGFDLYDLARQLAALDTIAYECLKLAPGPLFPKLRAFAPPCPCGRHPLKET